MTVYLIVSGPLECLCNLEKELIYTHRDLVNVTA